MVNLDSKLAVIPHINADCCSTQAFSQDYQIPGLPVVIDGLLGNNITWDLEHLCEHLKNQQFLIRCYGQARYQQDKRSWSNIGSGADVVQMPFQDYAQCLRSGQAQAQDMYLAKCPIGKTSLNHAEPFKGIGDRLSLRRPMSDFNLWVGPSGHVEALHYDPTDGTLVQLYGEKKIILFPPAQSSNLYPFPISVHFRHGLRLRCWFSQVTLNAPDFEVFPNLKAALPHRLEVILKPGETLYIPAGWWHEVTTLGTGMACSVNRFWGVSPFPRAVLSWQRWRTYLGSVAAIPHTLSSLGLALFSDQPREKVAEILRLI